MVGMAEATAITGTTVLAMVISGMVIIITIAISSRVTAAGMEPLRPGQCLPALIDSRPETSSPGPNGPGVIFAIP